MSAAVARARCVARRLGNARTCTRLVGPAAPSLLPAARTHWRVRVLGWFAHRNLFPFPLLSTARAPPSPLAPRPCLCGRPPLPPSLRPLPPLLRGGHGRHLGRRVGGGVQGPVWQCGRGLHFRRHLGRRVARGVGERAAVLCGGAGATGELESGGWEGGGAIGRGRERERGGKGGTDADSSLFLPPLPTHQRPPGNVERVAHLRSTCANHLNPTGPDAQIGERGGREGTRRKGWPPDNTRTHAQPSPPPYPEHVISLICRLFGVEDALLALLDGERVFIRSAAGRRFALGEFPWRCSFCGWSLANPTPQTLIVPDATADARFALNPFVVGPPFLRFYAGAPVVSRSTGHRLGTLCFADFKPRHLGPAGAATLNTLADLVAAELDRQAASAAAQRAAAALARAPSALRGADRVADGALLADTRSVLARVEAGSGGSGSSDGSTTLPPWPVLHASAAAAAALGLSGAGEGANLWSLFDLPAPRAGAPSTSAALAAAAARGRFFVLRGARVRTPPASPPTSAASDAAPPTVSHGTRLYDLAFWPSALGPPSTGVGAASPVGVPASIVASGAGADLDPGAGVFCVTLALAFASGGTDSPRTASRRPALPAALCSNGSPLSAPPAPPPCPAWNSASSSAGAPTAPCTRADGRGTPSR